MAGVTKRKLDGDHADSPSKKPKKTKSKALRKPADFTVLEGAVTLAIPPVFASRPLEGAREMLDSMVLRYVQDFQGVVLGHSNARFLQRNALLKADNPFAICDVAFEATVWCPQVGMSLKGSVNLASPDHLSLLTHGIFNVSIARSHIPQDTWAFAHGVAPNDPEFAEADGEENAEKSSGGWVHVSTNESIGGENGCVKFTVIGLKVAGGILSLEGSLQPDPFSPVHNRATTPPVASDLGMDVDDVDRQLEFNTADNLEDDQDLQQDEETTLELMQQFADREDAERWRLLDHDKETEKKEKSRKKKKKIINGDLEGEVKKKRRTKKHAD